MKDQLKAAMKDAMRAKDKISLETIRSLLSALQYEEMKQKVESLSEPASLKIIQSELKKQRESLEFAEKDARQDMIDELNTRIACISQFLPSQLSSEELTLEISKFISANEGAQVGQIMAHLKQNFSGQYDGKTASSLAKEAAAG